MKLSVEELLYEVVDGQKLPTAYMQYIVANKIKEFFKQNIERLDKVGDYSKIRAVEEVTKESFDNAMKQYSKQMSLVENGMEQWKLAHPDYYRQQMSLPSSKEVVGEVNLDFLNLIFTLEESIQGYKMANEIIKELNNSGKLDKFCICTKEMLNYEHRVEYNKEKERLMKVYGVPSKEELLAKLPKETVIKRRMSLSRSKSDNSKPFELASKELNSLIHNHLQSTVEVCE